MKALIVAKTRQGVGACIGAITAEGKSARLLAPPDAGERWGLEFAVGEVWEIEGSSPFRVAPPHIEDFVVRSRRKVREVKDITPTILRHMPPVQGGPDVLYDGLLRSRPMGALYIAGNSGIPAYSTTFWRPDMPLRANITGKRIRYFYPGKDGEQSLVFVGFQEPVHEIPAGTLLRVSLSHWWRSPETPDEELRCWAQLSGWIGELAVAPLGPHLAGRSYSRPEPCGDRMGAARREMARVFGFHEFRPPQDRIIANVLGGRDTLGIMPTGAGKSLCYQLPAVISSGLTVVVSPLLSLMQDQIDQLHAVGVPAVSLNSLLSYAEYTENIHRIRGGQVKLLYVAPETLLRPEILALLDESGVSLLTIDEAHCISEWGHDFRPEYRQLRGVRQRYPRAGCLALTATATTRVRDDIRSILGIGADDVFISGFDRPNLFLEVQRRRREMSQLTKFLKDHQGQSGILYCGTRAHVDELTEMLVASGVDALTYHAGLDDQTRRENQRKFQRDDVQIIVATIAFGMGINKSNVRFIVHCSMPDCLETYYQQIGRAGRDGLRADCLLLHGSQEIRTILHFIEEGAEEERRGRTLRMQAMIRYSESTVCRRKTLLTYFDDSPAAENCGMCDNCAAAASGRMEVDVSDDARLFLSCVKELRERFGASHVVDVLRGSQGAKVLRFKHDRLPSYGRGRHISKEEWLQLSDRFIERRLVDIDLDHGTIKLAEAANRVFDGEPVLVTELQANAIERASDEPQHDAVLFERLRRLRKSLADAAGVPPYVVFSDRALTEMCQSYPITLRELRGIHGVGERKCADYGAQFTGAIRKHIEENGIERPESSLRGEESPRWFATGDRRRQATAALFLEGLSVDEICARRGRQRSTILTHLRDYVAEGGSLPAERLLAECRLAESVRERALAVFREKGYAQLGPAYETLGGAAPYEELHLLRLYLMCTAGS